MVVSLLLNLDHAKYLNYELLIIGAPYFATRKPEQVIEFVKHISQLTDLAIMYYNSLLQLIVTIKCYHQALQLL